MKNMKNIKSKNFCLNCGKELKKKKNSKYCNNKCQQEYQYHEYIKQWKSGYIDGLKGKYQLSNNLRRYIIEKYNNQCCKCGWNSKNIYTNKIPLEVHHKDGNYLNNTESNLELLCPNCHSLTNTYKNTLNHDGRKSRNKYY